MILITKGVYSKKKQKKKLGNPQKKVNKTNQNWKTAELNYTWFVQTGVFVKIMSLATNGWQETRTKETMMSKLKVHENETECYCDSCYRTMFYL